MSKKFHKNREVTFAYFHVPLCYTFIKHPTKPHKELVLIDSFKTHYVAAYKNMRTCKVGRTFLIEKTKLGFIFKNKHYKHSNAGWVL